MTKKHFAAIAAVIRGQVEAAPNVGGHTYQRNLAHALADEFEEFNPHFDRARFLAACGVEGDMSSQETGTLFWTMDDGDGLPEVTLCETCALSATNPIMAIFTGDTYDNMTELMVTAEAYVSTVGATMGCSSATTGTCGNCGATA